MQETLYIGTNRKSYSTDYRIWRGGDGASTTDHAAGYRNNNNNNNNPTNTNAWIRGSSHTLIFIEIMYFTECIQ